MKIRNFTYALLSFFLLASCGINKKNVSYRLAPIDTPPEFEVKRYGSIGLRDIALPEYWSDRRIPVAKDRHKIIRANKNNLSENPQTVFYNAFKASLQRHNLSAVTTPPWTTTSRPKTRLDINITTLIGKPGETLVLEGYATLLGHANKQIPFNSKLAITDTSTSAYLNAISRGIDAVVKTIYQQLKPL